MGFILVAYYTEGDMYQESAAMLKSAAESLGIACEFVGIPSRGSWGRNTEYKPFFIKQCLEKFKDVDIAYTDADSMVHRYPDLFDNPTADIIIRKQDFPWRKNEFMSGTFFMRNTDSCMEVVNAWCGKVSSNETIRSKPETWEQHRLGQALVETGVAFSQLPHEYIYYDHIENIEGHVENPVFTHKQFSRKICK